MRKVKVAAVTLCLLTSGLLGGISRDLSVTVTGRQNCAECIAEVQLLAESTATATSIETTARTTETESETTQEETTIEENTTAEEETAVTETTTTAETTENEAVTATTAMKLIAANAAKSVPAVTATTETTATTAKTTTARTTTAKTTTSQTTTASTTAAAQNETEETGTEVQTEAGTEAAAQSSTASTAVTTAAATESEAPASTAVPKKAWESQITYSEYVMLCNMVGHEYGANWVSEYDKALIVEVIMNRVKSSQFPNTIYGVLTQRNQFPGMSYYINLGRFSSQVTSSVKKAVELYFEEPSRFNHGYLFYTGDGWRNYFRTRY